MQVRYLVKGLPGPLQPPLTDAKIGICTGAAIVRIR